MTKKDFLDEMGKGLSSMSLIERYEIMSDYEEHFARGVENGKTEEEICASLGNPSDLAKEYIKSEQNNASNTHANSSGPNTEDRSYVYERDAKEENKNYSFDARQTWQRGSGSASANRSSNSSGSTVIISILLLLANIIFVMPIYISVLGVWLSVFVVGLALLVAGIVLMFFAIVHLVFLFSGIALAALGALIMIAMGYAAYFLYRGTLWYINANVRFAKGGSI